MNRTSHQLARLAAVATIVVGLLLVTPGSAMAMIPAPYPGGPGDGYEEPILPPETDNSDNTLQWLLLAAAVLGALAVVAVVADQLGRRRWRLPPLDAALASSQPDELPRAAGLLGDLFTQHHCIGAAEYAYRAAIDADDQYWSPIAQVALADLLIDRGERTEAQALLEDAIISGHPRAVPAAQASLDQLRTGTKVTRTPLEAYETLESTKSAPPVARG